MDAGVAEGLNRRRAAEALTGKGRDGKSLQLKHADKLLGLLAEMSCGFSLGNFISTAEKIRLPDDCTIGYIIEALLEVSLTHTHLFHSHLENLQKLPTDTVLEQVSVCGETQVKGMR